MSVIDLSQLPAPHLIEPIDFETLLRQLKGYVNEQQPSLLDENRQPHIADAELVTLENGERYWRVPVGEEAGLYYLNHEADPMLKLLEQWTYREMLLRQRINEAAQALMIAHSKGADLDNMAADFNVRRLEGENDDRLRRRRQLAPESLTTAGSKGAYEYYSLTASIEVLDVHIARPAFNRVPDGERIVLEVTDNARLVDPLPGDVAVTVLPVPGADPEAVKTAVADALDTDSVIPYTDTPRLLDADVMTYRVDAELIVYPGPSAEPVIDAAHVALAAYTSEHFRLGHDISHSGLDRAAHQAGVQTVTLKIIVDGVASTDDLPVQNWQAAQCESINVTLGGRNV